jgi:hypothetical protein
MGTPFPVEILTVGSLDNIKASICITSFKMLSRSAHDQVIRVVAVVCLHSHCVDLIRTTK